ncbi:MAG: radical SAM protein [Eubacteriales bacterium]
MKNYKYLYGPVPSRRMGLSLGVSPIPKKTCNYSCIYCQLGRTDKMNIERQDFFPLEEIKEEFLDYIKKNKNYDVVTIVGEGEPTLYKSLGKLIYFLKKNTDKPIALITNGGLLKEQSIWKELLPLDIILPSLDASKENEFKNINRPHPSIEYKKVINGLIGFSKKFQGELWLEIMFVKDYNDSNKSIERFKSILSKVSYDRLFLNTPVRPPAENYVKEPNEDFLNSAVKSLKATPINLLVSEGFKSIENNHYESILTIIKRHPMNQYEIKSFLENRNCDNYQEVFKKLDNSKEIEKVFYKGYNTYRIK